MKKAIIVVLCFCVLLMCFPVQAYPTDTMCTGVAISTSRYNMSSAATSTPITKHHNLLNTFATYSADLTQTNGNSNFFNVYAGLMGGMNGTLYLSSSTAYSENAIAYLVEMYNSSVQSGSLTMTTTWQNITLTTPVANLSHAFIILSTRRDINTPPYCHTTYVWANLTSSTNLQLRSYSTQYHDATIVWWVVENPLINVTRKTWTGTGTGYVPFSFDTAHSFIFTTYGVSRNSYFAGNAIFDFYNLTHVRVRASAYTTTAVIQVITSSYINCQEIDVTNNAAATYFPITAVNVSTSSVFYTSSIPLGSAGSYICYQSGTVYITPNGTSVKLTRTRTASIAYVFHVVDWGTLACTSCPECEECNSTNLTVNYDLENVTGWTNTSYNSSNGWTVNVTYTGNTSAPCDCNSTNLTIQEFLTNCIGNYTTLYDPDTGWLVNNTYAGNCTGGNASKGMAYEYYPGIGLITAFAIMFFFAGYLVREGNKKKKKEQEVENEKI